MVLIFLTMLVYLSNSKHFISIQTKKCFLAALVWVRLYALPIEYWQEDILAGIGNTIGKYIKASEITKSKRYTAYSKIYIYMSVSKPLLKSIVISLHDEDITQPINYEHIPFHFIMCYGHDHLYKDFPLINPPMSKEPTISIDS